MKATYKFLLPALLAGFLLGGCAEKDAAAPAEEAMPEASAPAEEAAATEEAAPAAEEAASDEPGGYVPTDDERIPGETRP
jgi:outer membrane lipoprotein-sorting protein